MCSNSDILDKLVRYAGTCCLSTQIEMDAADEISRLRIENIDLNSRIVRYEHLLCSASPLSWVVHEDMDGAKEWEKKVLAAFELD